MESSENNTPNKLLKGIEIFFIQVYPFILVILVYTAWFLAIRSLGFKPMATVNDPKYFGGPTVYRLHTQYFFIVNLLPAAAFITARKSIKQINNNQGKEMIWSWVIWGSMILTFCTHPAYLWFID